MLCRESKGGYLNGKIKFVGITETDPIQSIELDLVRFVIHQFFNVVTY